MKILNKLFLLALVVMSIVSYTKESTEITQNEIDVDPKLEKYSETEVNNMTATDLLEIELNATLEQRLVTLTDADGNDLDLMIASENVASIAGYIAGRKLSLNGKVQDLSLTDYDLPTENVVRDAPVYVEFMQEESTMGNIDMILTVETIAADGANQRYDESDTYTSGKFIEGFNFTNLFFGPPAAVTRMLVKHEYKRSWTARWRTVSQGTVESGQSRDGCEDGRRTRVNIKHNSGPNDLYNFNFDNCA